jgi:hypothetical protein
VNGGNGENDENGGNGENGGKKKIQIKIKERTKI